MDNKSKLSKDQKRIRKIIFVPIFLSVLFHAVFLISKVDWSSKQVYKTDVKKQKKIKLVFKTKKKSKSKQIVNTELKKSKEVPKDAKFLGKQNQKVARETKAAINGSFKAAGKGVRNGSKVAKQQIAKFSKGHKKLSKKKSAIKKIAKKFNPKNIKLTDLGLGKMMQKKPASKSAPKLGIKHGNSRNSGLSRNNDFIEDLPLGDMTRLNTVEYKYYGFYYRIRQKLEQYWGDSLRKQAQKMWKSGRRIASDENKITSLQITIDKKGNIIDVFVKSTSGINELDEAAIESFNRAGPFPNPPTGLVKDGSAKIEWGFVVKS